ncbi:hypothetical protein KY284_034281 [Solanum tuberosum]|nr:hypothetical protein KY284_034281 [Solanum tuberosum]
MIPGADLDYRASWTSRPKRPIFIGQTIHGADVHYYLTYGASWPSRPKRPIFKVKRSPEHNSDHIFAWTSIKTLPIEPVSPNGQNVTFSKSNDPGTEIQNSNLIFAKILPRRPLTPYLWSQFALTAKTAHFQGQTIPRAEFPPHFYQNLTWTSIKTLPIEPVGPHG